MPLNCPQNRLEYNACLSCGRRHGNECWAIPQVSQKLADILTVEERISILEDRKEVPEVNIVTLSHQDYQQLQRLILSLKEKLETRIDSSKRKVKPKYD